MPERKGRHSAADRIKLRAKIAGHGQYHEDGRRAFIVDALDGAAVDGGCDARNNRCCRRIRPCREGRAHQFALGAETDVNGFEIQTLGGCAGRTIGRLRGVKREGLFAVGRGDASRIAASTAAADRRIC